MPRFGLLGQSEEIRGSLLAGRRENFVFATKFTRGADADRQGNLERWLVDDPYCDPSLLSANEQQPSRRTC